jgi:Ca-activated chloride channel homolog
MIGPNRKTHLNFRWPVGLVSALFILAVAPFFSASTQQTRPRRVEEQNPSRDEAQTIRLDTQLVNVLFSVTDKKNQYIKDLVKDEVTVLENGKPQQIFTFKREIDLPLTMVVLVDISNSVRPIIPRLTSASSRLIDSVMRPAKDAVAIVQFDTEATLIQDLTSNSRRLHSCLNELEHSLSQPRRREGILPPPISPGSRYGGTSIHDSIAAVCDDLLAKRSGRKTIILFTDGYDTTSYMRREDAIDEALRAETIIYAIGIGDNSQDGIDKTELKRLCEQTGGRAFIPESVEDLDRAFSQLEEELRQQYLLAYEPANDASDGSFRKIELRLRNRKGLLIHHRPGYYALKQ